MIWLTIFLLWSLQQFRDSENIPESATFIDSDRYLNFQFSATTTSVSSMKIWSKKTVLVDDYSTKKSFFFSLASESWFSENSKENFLILILLDTETQISTKL